MLSGCNEVMRNRFGVSACVALTLALTTVACSPSKDAASPSSPSSSSVPVSTTPPSPPGDLYRPPDPLQAGEPGTLIWAEKVEGLELNPPATVWRMLYHSRSEQDRDIAVSGFAVVPTAAPEGERGVYAWAHGTVGLGDECAPSHEVRDNLPPFGGQQIERGAVLVATDYEGVGTPGVPTFSGVAEGQAVLDSVRATTALPNVGSTGAVVVAGHSQGGPAALFAAEIAPSTRRTSIWSAWLRLLREANWSSWSTRWPTRRIRVSCSSALPDCARLIRILICR